MTHPANNKPNELKEADTDIADAQLRELFGQLEPPQPPKNLLAKSVRSATRANRMAVIGGTRRGFAFGAISASIVTAALLLVFVAPSDLSIDKISSQAVAWFDNDKLIASNEPVYWSDGEGSRDGDGGAQSVSLPSSQILNLTQADIRSQDVIAVLNVPTDLHNAVVRISLDSGIELRDLPGLNVVEWKSDFTRGDNILNLSLATIEEDIDRFNSVQVRVSHPDYSTEIWINIAREEHPGL